MPTPRGRRPSTAASTMSGARKASEIIIAIERLLRPSPYGDRLDIGGAARDDVVEPSAAVGDGLKQGRPRL